MTPGKILITGPTGFIGTRFCERLKLHYKLPFRAFVRNFTNANRIARMDVEMVAGDLRKPESIASALDGCDTVLHLAHSEDEYAAMETRNLLEAAARARIKRFVHISSMAVHGPHPGPECAREETATIGRYNSSYSDAKAEVEEIVQRAIKADGLPGVILRPTIVYGPYGPFVSAVIARARKGEISLIDEGKWFCNAVYVDDVCDAIHASLHVDAAVGKAMFVTADVAVTWRDFNVTFGSMVEPAPVQRNWSASEAQSYWDKRKPSLAGNLRALAKLPLSPELHRQFGTVPVFDKSIRWTKRTLKNLLTEEQVLSVKRKIRRASLGNGRDFRGSAPPDEGRLRRETFPIQFSNELARKVLDWKPAFDLTRGAAVTKTWLEFARMLKAGDAR